MQITVNEPGARTIRDSRPMQVDGQNVYVTLGSDGTASLHMGGQIVAERQVKSISTREAQDWAVAVRDERAAELDAAWGDWAEATHVDPAELADQVADEEAVAEACDPTAVYAGAVEQVRAQGAVKLAEAEEAAAHGDKPFIFTNIRGRKVRFTTEDPRHPARRAVALRKEAERLFSWSWQDEQGYSRYVSDGIADTDGWYAPLDRAAWKGTLAR